MFYKTNGFKLGAAVLIGVIVFLLPRPEGTQFKITGDTSRIIMQNVTEHFAVTPVKKAEKESYILKAKAPGSLEASAKFLDQKAKDLNLNAVEVDYVDGLSPKAKRFLAILAVLVILFVIEPIPLEITAVLIGVSLVVMQITDVKSAWAPYMHPVVIFIMCCLIFAIALDKAGLTKRLGYYIIKKAGNSITRFTFIIAIGLGLASSFMHDAAACAIGIVTMLPLMRAAGIEPNTNTAKFMMLSLPFACSSGGMGTLVGGGRCMVSAAFLKEFTGIEITFFQWMLYAMPAAIITVPIAVFIVYLVYRPDPKYTLPEFDEDLGPMTTLEKKTMTIIALSFMLWLTKGLHGIDYSVTGMLGVAALVLFKALKWRDINDNLEWGTALFIFGGGISLGLAMGYSGAADYFANLFFPLIQGKGWLVLFIGVGIFGALVTNAMANVAAAALILPIVIPIAQLEGVDPTILALCLGMATSFAMLLVIGCPPNAIAYSYRYFKSSDLTKVGLVATPILLTVLVIVAGVWWKILGLI
ncbi:MAG: DASS family sodium-coupled anion symporter [Desulfobacula sp.]|jgi:solute carrier family 13 (sodium-dependent dicarboxylate transporter), member 2/3/5|uniref:SLC13 family permease n=1 Tax=Desulfobacula sp. TaxID=2593537 RepID=UPI001D9B8875|nr:DASS family sodium-coupled anion symporter [Desulfobacula sp.]MBT6338394.1 DASS family sodium-coupled anion symporter [Desulfobacula sp.]MBT6751301.1 DASS family sodium-coupled anion symporter [Desulfobacula sp.]